MMRGARAALSLALTLLAATAAADRFDDARDYIEREMREQSIPAVSVAVAHRGAVIWEQGFGWANREARVPATEHTMYLLASISKTFAATGLMALVERGRIDLDRPVNDYLGDAKLTARVGDARDATVRRVANHTAGLPIHYDFFFSDETVPVRDRDLTVLRYGNITSPPGERFEYSNLGFGVIDAIIARVDGRPYAQFMQDELFEPLGLTHTSVGATTALERFRAIGYHDDGKPIPLYVSDDHGGAGTVMSSAHDLVRYGLFHLKHRQREQRPILSDAALDAMHTPSTATVPNEGYAIGWRTQDRDGGRRLVYHRGASPGASTLLWTVAKDDLVIVVLTNSRSGREPLIAEVIAKAVVKDWPAARPTPPQAPAPPPPTELLGQWAGTLHTYERDRPLSLTVAASGEVKVSFDGEPEVPLNRASFRDGWLRGYWDASPATRDSRPRGRAVTHLFLKLRDGRLIGSSSATSEGMRANSLSHWVELRRPVDTQHAHKVDAVLKEITRADAPGLAVGVYRQGSLVYAKGFGLADLETRTPITSQTIFHVASVSKQFTAFAIALLAREGKVDLDADVRKYLPAMPDFGQVITVRDLIQHTSGLRDQWMLSVLAGVDTSSVIRQQYLVNMIERQRALNFEPGTRYAYSNSGYTLLAEIVKAVSGKSLREFTTERIFTPLGMNRTFFNDDVSEVVPGRALSYQKQGDGWKRALLNFDNVGATSLFTTVEDLARWAGNFAHPQVGDAQLIAQLGAPGRLRDGTAINYGFALHRQSFAGHEALMHFGSDAGYRAAFAYFPAEDFAVLLAANTPPPDQQRTLERIVDIYLNDGVGRLPGPLAEVKPKASLLAAASGTYMSRHGRMVSLATRDGRLVYRTGFGELPMVFRADGTFEPTPRNWTYYRPFRLRHDARGGVDAFEIVDPLMQQTEVFERAVPVTPTASELAQLAGDYRSSELDVTYSLTVQNGALLGRSMRMSEVMRFTPATRDRFDTRLGVIEFVRDGAHAPVAFKLHSTGVDDILFERIP